MEKKPVKVNVTEGKIEPLEPLDIKLSGRAILVFEDEIGDYDEEELKITPGILSEKALMKIWDNPEDDIYNDL